jgi:hypothetical protein
MATGRKILSGAFGLPREGPSESSATVARRRTKKQELVRRLTSARRDYAAVMEREFSSFFCPILYRDEATDLCLGHVVNEAFTSSDRTRVLQRADVDSFFGAKFESDFVLLDHYGKVTAADALMRRGLPSKLRPRILLRGISSIGRRTLFLHTR